jgi:orotidine-5'-phosphate decarboxylase
MSTQLIVALDVSTLAEARSLVRELRGIVKFFKIGSELFTAAGPAAVKMVLRHGGQVFLDLKFHDIPNTVARAVDLAARQGVSMLTVHASGGEAMLRAAAEASRATRGKSAPLVLGVTVLTSLDRRTLKQTGVPRTPELQAQLLARLARRAGVGGLVCSPLELRRLRALAGKQMKLVAPGIRPLAAASDDQLRISTPAEAARAGADYIVAGRPVIAAADPRAAAQAIQQELRGVRRA